MTMSTRRPSPARWFIAPLACVTVLGATPARGAIVISSGGLTGDLCVHNNPSSKRHFVDFGGTGAPGSVDITFWVSNPLGTDRDIEVVPNVLVAPTPGQPDGTFSRHVPFTLACVGPDNELTIDGLHTGKSETGIYATITPHEGGETFRTATFVYSCECVPEPSSLTLCAFAASVGLAYLRCGRRAGRPRPAIG